MEAVDVFGSVVGEKIEKAIATNIDNFLKNNGTEKYLPNIAGATIDYSFDSATALQFWENNSTSAYLNGTFFNDKQPTKPSHWQKSTTIAEDFSRMVNL